MSCQKEKGRDAPPLGKPRAAGNPSRRFSKQRSCRANVLDWVDFRHRSAKASFVGVRDPRLKYLRLTVNKTIVI
jgi:hypothetical protein